ncbi:MAG: PASTA domain-containing protein [Armatimonadota bacterium]|nr:MAG: PASTA domain-containing protein [Armatimonadota bacterium]
MWPRRERPRRALLPQFLELLVIIGFLAAFYHGITWYWEYTAPEEVTVPKLVGLTEREATSVLESIGLRAAVVGQKPDEEVPEGGVLLAEPPPERKVKVGRLVRLTLSSGSRWSVVPDVREMSVDRARALLRKAGLSVGREKAVYDSKVPIGYVVAHVPEAGEQVPRNMGVDLLVSKGPAPRSLDVEPAAAARSTYIDFIVPPGPGLQEVRIVVQDDEGERTAYKQVHKPGERIVHRVSGKGSSISVRVYLSGEVMQERAF